MQRKTQQDYSGNFPESCAKSAKFLIIVAILSLICFGFGCGESVEEVDLPSGRPDAQLLIYTSNGDLRAVKYLIVKLKANPNAMVVSSTSDSALHIAVKKGYSDIALYLIKKGANVNAVNYSGQQPLQCAIQSDSLELTKALLKAGAKIDNKNSATLLRTAIAKGNVEIVSLLIKNNADINVKDDQGETPLFWAVDQRNLVLVDLLIKKGAQTDITNTRGYSPLFRAVTHDDLDTVKLLEKKGLKISPTDTKLLIAASSSGRSFYPEMLAYLLQRGIRPDKDVLINAVISQDTQLLSMLLQNECNFNKDQGGDLYDAAMQVYNAEAIIQVLISAKIKPCGGKGKISPLVRALMNNEEEFLLLLKAGADINEKNMYDGGRRPLHYAIDSDLRHRTYTSQVELLLKAGADPQVDDFIGYAKKAAADMSGGIYDYKKELNNIDRLLKNTSSNRKK